jgi:glutaredoxin
MIYNTVERREMAKPSNLYSQHPDVIMVYGADWCPDCLRVQAFLDQQGVKYTLVDTGADPQAYEFLEKILRRVRLPTLFFPDGSMAVEPSKEDLARRLAP